MLRFYAQGGLSTIIINFDEDLGGSWHQRIKNWWCDLSVWIKGGSVSYVEGYTCENYYNFTLQLSYFSTNLQYKLTFITSLSQHVRLQTCDMMTRNDNTNIGDQLMTRRTSINIQHEEQPRHGGRGFLVDCWDLSGPGGKSQVVPINALLSFLKEMTFNLQAGVRVRWAVDILFSVSVGLSCHVTDCLWLSRM